MKSLVITPKNEKELEFISVLLKKLGISSEILSEEEKLDAGLLLMMQEADKKETVSKEEIISKLKS